MSLFKCKMCGGSLEIAPNATVIECEYCGTPQTLPKLHDEKLNNMFERADQFRRAKDFDRALEIYEEILTEVNDDSELYWSMVLCRYGIEYVDDPMSHQKIPTVNRAQFTSIYDDADYQSAIKYADTLQKILYEKEAAAINEIQRDILAISNQEEPYDVFICYKETDNNGERTHDSVDATELYYELTEMGLKVFFSRITLEDKLGTAYEPYIFAALNSAKVMVVIGSKPEYFNAVWVKNEWSRFLALMKNDRKRTLIPAYRNMDAYSLPKEFSHLQALDMSKLGFMSDLTRGIKKIIGEKPQAQPQFQPKPQPSPQPQINSYVATSDNTDSRSWYIGANKVSYETIQKIKSYMAEGKKLEAIKYIREVTGLGLADARYWVENYGHLDLNHKQNIPCQSSTPVEPIREPIRDPIRDPISISHPTPVKKKGGFVKKIISWIITLGIIGALFALVVWPNMIYPNLPNNDLYTPEIIQIYSGLYRAGDEEGEANVTILSCDAEGNVTGYFEFVVGHTYGKYEVSGKISEKKNSGNLILTLKSGQWLVQADNYSPLETMTVEISNQYQKFECDQYGISWSAGFDDSNSITTADDLKKLSNSDGVFQLKNDIDLEGQNWTPITGFSGTLLGNGYSIKNLTIRSSGDNVGLFDSISGSVSNLKLENVNIEVQGGYKNVGALCGSTSGSISGCEVTGSIVATRCTNVGGIVGQVSSNDGRVMNCKNTAIVQGSDNVGGIAGHICTMFSFTFISNENSGTVSGNNYVGGLLGCVAPQSVDWTEMSGDNFGDLVMKQCVNNGSVTGNNYVGGMSGSFSGTSTHLGFGDYYTITASMSDNTNNATITGKDYVGGMAGYTGDVVNNVSNCYNNADITGNYYVGGYVGYSSTAEITDAENKNKISGKAYVGGIVGVGYSVRNCVNNGIVESTGTFLSDNMLLSCTGGIAGQANFVHACVNNKDIIVGTNGYYVGGVVGIIKSDAIIDMDGNKNYGNVSGYAYVGGFAGAISSQPGPGDINYYEGTLVISNVVNSGNISAATKYAGGITGFVEGAYRHYGFGNCKNVTYQISYCNNTGNVSGTANIDGIVGKIGEYVVTEDTVLKTNESTGQITLK